MGRTRLPSLGYTQPDIERVGTAADIATGEGTVHLENERFSAAAGAFEAGRRLCPWQPEFLSLRSQTLARQAQFADDWIAFKGRGPAIEI